MSELHYRAFFRGAARAVDLFGTLDKGFPFVRDDGQALEKDWKAVGSGLQKAIDTYATERQPA